MSQELDHAQLEGMTLTLNELRIIREMRRLGPYGFLQVTADAQGKLDSYLVHKSSKIVLSAGQEPKNIKTGL